MTSGHGLQLARAGEQGETRYRNTAMAQAEDAKMATCNRGDSRVSGGVGGIGSLTTERATASRRHEGSISQLGKHDKQPSARADVLIARQRQEGLWQAEDT